MKYYLAIDIGASSGRHIVGHQNEAGDIITEEVYRFDNWIQEKNGHYIWDIDNLFKEVKKGIKAALKKYPIIESLSIDTWGVDYVLLDKNDKEIYPAYSYRDHRMEAAIPRVHRTLPLETLYSITGVQFQKFNTIYQLYSDKLSGRLARANDFLMIPEYLIWKLTAVKCKEYTNASTTGLYDGRTYKISDEICDKLGFPDFVKQPVYKPGTFVGPLKPSVVKEVGRNVNVVLCPTHDTASGFAALELDDDTITLISGTWSILGITSKEAITTEEAFDTNYSNEFGAGYICFIKNIMGMWIINSISKEINMNVVDMVKIAKESSYHCVFDVNDNDFYAPESMKEAIKHYFLKHNKPIPETDGDIINSVYHSLAHCYKTAIEELEMVTKRTYSKLCIVGGGAKNTYLNDLVEKCSGKKIIALPIEATSIGNIASQIKADNLRNM